MQQICQTIKKKAKEDIKKYNQEIIRHNHGIKDPEESQTNAEVRPRQTDHTPTHAGREIYDQDNTIERKEELYTELYDSEKSTIVHADPKAVPEITSWEVEAALRYMKNGIATRNDHINIETLKAGEYNISKTFAKLYIKCLSERRIPTA